MRLTLTAFFVGFLLLPTISASYDWTSVRILSLGEGLSGFVEDEFTDAFRNPAYVGLLDRNHLFTVMAPQPTDEIGRHFLFGTSGPVISASSFGMGGAADFWFLQNYSRPYAYTQYARSINSDYGYAWTEGPVSNRFGTQLAFGISFGGGSALGFSANGGMARPIGTRETEEYSHETTESDAFVDITQRWDRFSEDSWEDSLTFRVGYLGKLSKNATLELFARYRWQGLGLGASRTWNDLTTRCLLQDDVPESCRTIRTTEAYWDQRERVPNARSLRLGMLLWRRAGRNRTGFQAAAGATMSEAYTITHRAGIDSVVGEIQNLPVQDYHWSSFRGTSNSKGRSYYAMLGLGGTRYVGESDVAIHWACAPWFYQLVQHTNVETVRPDGNANRVTSAKADRWYNEYSLELNLAVEVPFTDRFVARFGNSSSVRYAKTTTDRMYATYRSIRETVRTESYMWPEGTTEFHGGIGFHVGDSFTIDIYSLDIAKWEDWKVQSQLSF